MTNPQVHTRAELHIYEGMSVDTVKRNGSDGQKIAVSLFDTDGNGKLEGAEVTQMNNCTFKSEPNKLTIWEKRSNGTQSQLEIKYKDLDELYSTDQMHANFIDNFEFWFCFDRKNSDLDEGKYATRSFQLSGNYDKVSIDMTNGKATVDGAHAQIYGHNIDLTVKNSSIPSIAISKGIVNLENTKFRDLLLNLPTWIKAGEYGETVVNIDDKSEATVLEGKNNLKLKPTEKTFIIK